MRIRHKKGDWNKFTFFSNSTAARHVSFLFTEGSQFNKWGGFKISWLNFLDITIWGQLLRIGRKLEWRLQNFASTFYCMLNAVRNKPWLDVLAGLTLGNDMLLKDHFYLNVCVTFSRFVQGVLFIMYFLLLLYLIGFFL